LELLEQELQVQQPEKVLESKRIEENGLRDDLVTLEANLQDLEK